MNMQKLIAIAIPAALIYFAATGKIKNATLATAVVAVGAGTIVKQIPIVNQYLG